MRLAFLGPSLAQGRRPAHRVYLVHSFPTQRRLASSYSLGRRAEYRNDSTMRRHASIALAPFVSLLGARRGGTRGDYAEATLVPKLVRKGQGNQSFAESHHWLLLLNETRNTSTYRLLRYVCKETGKLLHRCDLNTVVLRRPYKEECERLKG